MEAQVKEWTVHRTNKQQRVRISREMAHGKRAKVRDMAGKERQQPGMTAWHRSFDDESAGIDMKASV